MRRFAPLASLLTGVVALSFAPLLAAGSSPPPANVLGSAVSTDTLAQTSQAACVIGRHAGVEPSDVEAAASLVCAELVAIGIDVGEPVAEAPAGVVEVFRVGLSRLGDSLVLEVVYESPPGVIGAREIRRLDRIDDVFDAAPEVADAIAGSPDQASEEPVAPGPPTPPPAEPPPTAQQAGGAACLVGDHAGVADSDAETAASLVCDELRARGVHVQAPTYDATGFGSAYRVTLRRLGQLVILEVSEESPPGLATDSRRLQLSDVEEVAVAAPRVVDSLVRRIPIEETAGYDSLVGEETREPGQRAGETFFGIGIVGAALPRTSVLAAPGLGLKFFYEADRYAIGTDLLFLGGPGGDEAALFISWSVGGRYIFGPGNGSFFAGGGFAWDTIGAYSGPEEERLEGMNTGIGFYGDIGWEFFRHYGTRLIVDLRVDVPFFDVDKEYEPEEGPTLVDTIYIVPVSLTVSYNW